MQARGILGLESPLDHEFKVLDEGYCRPPLAPLLLEMI